MSEQLMTVEEVATWLRVSKAWVSAHANGNRMPVLPSQKIGKCLRFKREAVEQFLKDNERRGKAA